ncbi:unnamed protein product [Paramecium pentaurelia]|uniref:RING-type domain-containing protein n=1 Tax=Paramecium pentaurelia TaxID=43138 RepID=A0A8S1Y426_9CILI|nr:unnamed protein product [Paramecium pentaurelia]
MDIQKIISDTIMETPKDEILKQFNERNIQVATIIKEKLLKWNSSQLINFEINTLEICFGVFFLQIIKQSQNQQIRNQLGIFMNQNQQLKDINQQKYIELCRKVFNKSLISLSPLNLDFKTIDDQLQESFIGEIYISGKQSQYYQSDKFSKKEPIKYYIFLFQSLQVNGTKLHLIFSTNKDPQFPQQQFQQQNQLPFQQQFNQNIQGNIFPNNFQQPQNQGLIQGQNQGQNQIQLPRLLSYPIQQPNNSQFNIRSTQLNNNEQQKNNQNQPTFNNFNNQQFQPPNQNTSINNNEQQKNNQNQQTFNNFNNQQFQPPNQNTSINNNEQQKNNQNQQTFNNFNNQQFQPPNQNTSINNNEQQKNNQNQQTFNNFNNQQFQPPNQNTSINNNEQQKNNQNQQTFNNFNNQQFQPPNQNTSINNNEQQKNNQNQQTFNNFNNQQFQPPNQNTSINNNEQQKNNQNQQTFNNFNNQQFQPPNQNTSINNNEQQKNNQNQQTFNNFNNQQFQPPNQNTSINNNEQQKNNQNQQTFNNFNNQQFQPPNQNTSINNNEQQKNNQNQQTFNNFNNQQFQIINQQFQQPHQNNIINNKQNNNIFKNNAQNFQIQNNTQNQSINMNNNNGNQFNFNNNNNQFQQKPNNNIGNDCQNIGIKNNVTTNLFNNNHQFNNPQLQFQNHAQNNIIQLSPITVQQPNFAANPILPQTCNDPSIFFTVTMNSNQEDEQQEKIVNNFSRLQTNIITKVEDNSTECDICCEKYYLNSDQVIITPCCKKKVHLQCTQYDLNEKAKLNMNFQKIVCHVCGQSLKQYQDYLKSNISIGVYVKIIKCEITANIPSICCKCSSPIQASLESKQVEIECLKCNTKLCSLCYQEYHGEIQTNQKCPSLLTEIQKAIADMPILVCPFCNLMQTKDNKCNHVTCYGCKIDLCSACSVERFPILEHGNHYHRVGCPDYAPLIKNGEVVTEPEFLRRKCKRCKETNQPCQYPISLDEYKKEKQF